MKNLLTILSVFTFLLISSYSSAQINVSVRNDDEGANTDDCTTILIVSILPLKNEITYVVGHELGEIIIEGESYPIIITSQRYKRAIAKVEIEIDKCKLCNNYPEGANIILPITANVNNETFTAAAEIDCP